MVHCAYSNSFHQVNVLTHVKEVTIKPEKLEKIEKVKERHAAQDQEEISVFKIETGEGKKAAENDVQQVHLNESDQTQYLCGKEDAGPNLLSCSFDDAESGALWDIFRQQDVPKLEEYIKRHFNEFRHIHGNLLQEVI